MENEKLSIYFIYAQKGETSNIKNFELNYPKEDVKEVAKYIEGNNIIFEYHMEIIKPK